MRRINNIVVAMVLGLVAVLFMGPKDKAADTASSSTSIEQSDVSTHSFGAAAAATAVRDATE